MDFKELETFLTIVEKGSISAAAAALGISQPAVSKRIARLEAEMEAQIFAPGHRHCELTQEGELFLRGVSKLIELRQKMKEEIAQGYNEMSGQIALAASSVLGDTLLPQLMAKFQKRNPKVRMSLIVSDSQESLAALAEHRVDLAVIGVDRSLPGHSVQPFYNDELVVITPLDHRWTQQEFVTFSDLEHEPMVGRMLGSATRTLWEKEYRHQFHVLKEADLLFNNSVGVVNAVAAGAGVAVLSRLVGQTASEKVAVLTLQPKIQRQFFLVRGQCEKRPVKEFAEFLLEQAEKERGSTWNIL